MSVNSSPSRLRPFKPTPFGRYTLLLPLASGGMGEVLLARLEGGRGLGKLCVIKRILPHHADNPEFVERFVNEAKVLVQLSHGSIAQVLDMGLYQQQPFLALEYVDGKDLRRVLARVHDRHGSIPVGVVLFIACRVLDALSYAHRKRGEDDREIGLVHRDISPQNILVSYEGEVKVIDFGLVKSALNVGTTHPSIVLGKLMYMSPEQARHQTIDGRSDLYSLGLCLYELLAGHNPFHQVASGGLIAQMAAPQIPPLLEVAPSCHPALAAVVMKSLEVEPERRFASAAEFRRELLGCLLQLDPDVGPETVSRYMRELFATEYQQERRMLASLREPPRVTAPAPAPGLEPRTQTETQVFTLDEAPPPSTDLNPMPVSNPHLSNTITSDIEVPFTGERPTMPGLSMVTDPTISSPWASPDQTLEEPESLAMAQSPATTDGGMTTVEAPVVRRPRLPRWVAPAVVLSLLAVGGGWLTVEMFQPVPPPPPESPPPPTSLAPTAPARAVPPPPAPAAPSSAPAPETAVVSPGTLEVVGLPEPESPEPVEPAPSGGKKPLVAKKPAPKKAPKSDVRQDYEKTKKVFGQLTRVHGCEALGLLCQRFEGLTARLEQASAAPEDAEEFLHDSKQLRGELEAWARER